MRKLVVLLALCSTIAEAQQRTKPLNEKIGAILPPQTEYVTDAAHIIGNRDSLVGVLKGIRQSTKLNLVVVTLPSIGDYAISDVSLEIARRWFVATANDTLGVAIRNTGGVILLVPSIRRCRVEVATGSEGYMTDSRAAELCRSAAPYFRNNDFTTGFATIATGFARFHQAEMEAAIHKQVEATTPQAPSKPFPWGIALSFLGLFSISLAWWGRRVHLENKKRDEAERIERLRIAKVMEQQRKEQERREQERARLRAIELEHARERERIRWNSLTPAQQREELRDRHRREAEELRLAAIRAAADAEQARLDAIRRAAEQAEDDRRRSSYSSNSDSSSSSSSTDYSSGGSDSFSGGGGGSDY